MNWMLIFYVFVSLVVLMSIFLTVLLFFRFKRREKEKGIVRPQSCLGSRFQRYMPSKARAVPVDPRAEVKQRRRNISYKVFDVFIISVGITVIVTSFYLNGDKFQLRIDLSSMETKKLNQVSKQSYNWVSTNVSKEADFSDLKSAFQKKNIVLLHGKTEEIDESLKGRSYPKRVEETQYSWEKFFQDQKIPYFKCEWKDAEKCRRRFSGPILWVVSLSWWDFEFIDSCLKRGENFLLQGPPLQIFSGQMKSLNWEGLSFFPLDASAPWARHLSLVGDEVLTAGADAGQLLELPPITNQFYVYTIKPQAVSMGETVKMGGPVKTRVYAEKVAHGKVVWMDYLPREENRKEYEQKLIDELTARIFRYALNEKYSALATWPDVARMAVMLSQDVEDKYFQAEKVIELFKRHDFPITFFALSNESQMNRALTQRMALLEKAEMACHGDSHDVFSEQERIVQISRLARCRKVVQKLTGFRPIGFRPPEERFDSTTLDSLANLNMAYFFGSSEVSEAVPKILFDPVHKRSLVSLPRINSDDYELWYRLNLGEKESFERMKLEASWVSMIGGLYSFSFHSQFIGDEDNYGALEKLLSHFSTMNVWRATGSQVSAWWRFRKSLLNGEEVESKVFNTFRPHVVEVSESGELHRKPLGLEEYLRLIKNLPENKQMRSLSASLGG